MKTAFKYLSLLFALAVPVVAAEPADSLRALGAQIKEKDGEVTEITFKDSSKLGDAEFRLIGKCAKLKSLTLYGGCAGLNDQNAPLLANLTELENLGTDGVKLSDNGFTSLAS